MTAIAERTASALDARARFWLDWDKLTARLAELGLSLADLPGRAGISESTISRLRTRTVSPSVGTLKAIAEAVALPMQDLLVERTGNGS